MVIQRYSSEYSKIWDDFVLQSKNGTFLFCRGYMDYHSDRFVDHSLMFYDEKNRLVALLPGNEKDGVYYTHQGLTYGGFVLSSVGSTLTVMSLFGVVSDYLRKNGFSRWLYKQIPYIYHLMPSQEDDYALFRNNAKIETCNISTTIEFESVIQAKMDPSRRRNFNKCDKLELTVVDCLCPDLMWPIMEKNLKDRYDAQPVHSLEEMKMLMDLFPNNIKCHLLLDSNGGCIGGAIVYVSGRVAHLQYAHVSSEGKAMRATDFLYISLVNKYSSAPGVRYFDFGTSNENAGLYLNENLISQKEGFGGRGIAYKIYSIEL